MSVVVTFVDYVPPVRFDDNPWTGVEIEEATTSTGSWTVIDTLTFSDPDADPTNPAVRSFTTSLGTADELWYRITFVDANDGRSQPSLPNQNVISSTTPYATAEELALLLRVKVADRRAALDRVLIAAAGEIEDEIGSTTPLTGWQVALAAEVNLERAVEHWHQQQAPFGIVGLGGGESASYTARDSWDRHAHKLAPLKQSWGLA